MAVMTSADSDDLSETHATLDQDLRSHRRREILSELSLPTRVQRSRRNYSLLPHSGPSKEDGLVATIVLPPIPDVPLWDDGKLCRQRELQSAAYRAGEMSNAT